MQKRLGYWHLFSASLLVESCIGAVEADLLIHCHTTPGTECWPWFFLFTVNLPVSLLSAQLAGLISTSSLGFYPQLLSSFLAYALVGSLWWAMLLWLVIKLVRVKHA